VDDVMKIESRKIRESARGEDCTLNILGACNYNPETTVLAHLPDESHGMGRKSDDLSACFACSACHDVADGRALWPINGQDSESRLKDWYYRRAQTRTWRRLIEMGVIKL
jgi:hypothetical protein